MKIEKEKKPQYRVNKRNEVPLHSALPNTAFTTHFENSDELCEYMAAITGGVTMQK